jgi:ABC-2 type transport system permease protein
MSGFFSLVSIETKKIRHRVSTWIMVIILAVLILGLSGLLKYIYSNPKIEAMFTGTQQSDTNTDWQTALQNEITADKAQLAQAESSTEQPVRNRAAQLKIYIAKDQYALDHNLDKDALDSVWNRVAQLDSVVNPNIGGIIALFVIITLSTLVAGEFSDGTIRMMIPRPYSRGEILSAKLLSILLYTLILFGEALVVGFLCMGLFFGFHGIGAASLFWTGAKVIEIPAVVNTLIIYGLHFLHVFVYISFALMIAVLSRSRAMSTGISIFLLIVGASLFQLLATFFTWGKYIVFAVSDLSTFITRGPLYEGSTLGFALIVSAIWVAVFLFFSYFSFRKRDI